MLILKDKILRQQILQISWPAMVEMILYMIIGVVDVAIVGRLGAAPLAAVGLGAEIFFSIVLLFEALSVGSSVLVAQAKGAGNENKIIQITGHTIVFGILIGIVTAVLGLTNADALLQLFSVEPAVYADALDYLLITFKITPLAITLAMLLSIFRGLGRTDIPMTAAIAINIINLLGDYLLVYGKFGFPALGVAGAAWATSLAHIAGIIFIIYFLFSGKGGINFDWKLGFKLRGKLLKDILFLGSPSFIEQFFWAASNLLSIFLIVYIGTLAYASHQLAITVESISFMPGFGIAIAATALVGQNIGAKNLAGVKNAARGTIEFALLIMGVFALLFAVFPYQIALLFTNDSKIIELSGTLIRIAALEQLTIAASMVMGGILKGAGDTRTPMIVSTLFTWGFRLPLMYLFIKVLALSITYVWFLFIIDWALRTVTYVIIMRKTNWLKKAMQKQLNEPAHQGT